MPDIRSDEEIEGMVCGHPSCSFNVFEELQTLKEEQENTIMKSNKVDWVEEVYLPHLKEEHDGDFPLPGGGTV